MRNLWDARLPPGHRVQFSKHPQAILNMNGFFWGNFFFLSVGQIVGACAEVVQFSTIVSHGRVKLTHFMG